MSAAVAPGISHPEVILEEIPLEGEESPAKKAPPKEQRKSSIDSSLGPSASVSGAAPCCVGCFGASDRTASASSALTATNDEDDDEAKQELEGMQARPPSLGSRSSSFAPPLRALGTLGQSTRALSRRVSQAWSDLFYDAEEPDEETEKQFFRSISRKMSKRSVRRRDARMRQSMRDLGILAIDDADIPPNIIRAAKGDMAEARRLYVPVLKWRRENKIDTILLEKQEDFEHIAEASPHFLCGYAKDGALVSYELNGMTDPHLFAKYKIKPADVARHSACAMEYSCYVLQEGRRDGQYYAVFDLKGMTLSKASSPILLQVLRAYAENLTYNYPDVLKKVLVVNPPFGAGTIIKVLRAVLPHDFNERIEVLYDNKELLKYIDEDQLLVQYGGKNTATAATSPMWQGLLDLIHSNRRGDANFVYARHLATNPSMMSAATDSYVTVPEGKEDEEEDEPKA